MNEFSTLELQDFIDNLDSTSQLYTALLNSPLSTDNESLKETAIKHLQAIWPIKMAYFSKDAALKQRVVGQFLQQKKDAILKELNKEDIQDAYFSFLSPNADFQNLQNQAYNIIVTDEQLQSNAIKAKLSELFHANPNHTLILCISGNDFVKDGLLTLYSDNLPTSLKHLRLLDPNDNVISIGNSFLFGCTDLVSVDLSGLTQVISIGNDFLSNCTGLASVNLSGSSYLNWE